MRVAESVNGEFLPASRSLRQMPDVGPYCPIDAAGVPDHDNHEREISVSVWGRMLPSTRIAWLHRGKWSNNNFGGTEMRKTFVASLALASLLGLAAGVASAAGEEVQGIKVNKENGAAGDGNSIMMKGSPLPLRGQAIKVGEPMPSATVTAGNLAPVNMAAGTGKVRIISVVPSVDTPTCEAQTH